MAWDRTAPRKPKYGHTHQQARRTWAAQHQPQHPCTRCHLPLGPMRPQLHLDHAEDGTYLGFAHATCNKRAGAIKGSRIAHHAKRRTHLRW